jgi:ABC-type histidine transport system ATPase subunit
MPPEAALALTDMHTHIGQFHILQGVTFAIREAGITALSASFGDHGKLLELRFDPGNLVDRVALVRRITTQAEYQLRADSNLLDEIQKRSDLRRREVARGMIGIERIEFFRPFRQDLNKLASRQ